MTVTIPIKGVGSRRNLQSGFVGSARAEFNLFDIIRCAPLKANPSHGKSANASLHFKHAARSSPMHTDQSNAMVKLI